MVFIQVVVIHIMKRQARLLVRQKTWWSQYPFVPTNNGYYEKEWKNLGYGAWQFSSTAYIPGRENMGALDLSIDFNGLFSKSDTTEKTVTQQVLKTDIGI